MEKSFIIKRIYELSQKEYLDGASNEILLRNYHVDKQNDVPPRMSEARELLIMGNEKLVFKIMRDTFGISELSRDIDEYSVGMMGLIKAVDTFDINRNVAFSTYATQVIINQIRMEYRKRNKSALFNNKAISINSPAGSNADGDVFYIEDQLGECDDTIENIINNQNIKTLKSFLQFLKREEVVAVVYGYGLFGNKKLNQNTIAKLLGVNQGNVSKLMKSARKKLILLNTPNSQLSPKELSDKLKLQNIGYIKHSIEQ